jgi:hypothetical protein
MPKKPQARKKVRQVAKNPIFAKPYGLKSKKSKPKKVITLSKKQLSKKKMAQKVVKKQIKKDTPKKAVPKIILKGEVCGKCEGCGKPIKIGDNYGRWADDVLTCAACSPIKNKAHGKSIKPTKPKVSKLAKFIAEIKANSLPPPKAKPNIVKPAGAVKLVRFKRESDREYSARVVDAKSQARLTKKGRRLSNKEIAYLMLHNALTAYPEIAALSEMQTAAGHKLRGSRVEKIKNVLRRRIGKMLRPINALLDKRGIINTEPEEITDAPAAQAENQSGGIDPVQQAQATG